MGSQFHHGHVSSPRHVKRSVRISRTALSCSLHTKGYGTYPVGTAFSRGRCPRLFVKQPKALNQPLPPPPLPTEPPPFPCTHQMPSHLLFHPIFDKTKAPTGVTHRKVPDPAP